MRSQGQIRHQLKQVIFRHLQKQLRLNFKQRPDTCGFNRRVDLGVDSHVNLCGVTSAAGEPRNIPCDSRIPGCMDMARECPLWEPLKSKAEVKAEFHEIIQSGDRGVIAAEYPDIAALLWVLDESQTVPNETEVEAAVAGAGDEEHGPARSWWSGFLKKLGGGT